MKEIISENYKRKVKRLKGRSGWGLTFQEERIIKICPKKNRDQEQLIDTIVHEEIHAVYPEFNEREVVAWTDTLVESLSVDQKRKYLGFYGYDFVE